MAQALEAHKFNSTQARYDEYEIQSISLFDGLHDFTNNELTYYQKLNNLLPTLDDKKQSMIDDENKLKQIIKDYNIFIIALANNEQELNNIDLSISFEIDLIWRVHLLSTSQYFDDCMLRFGKIIKYKYNQNINKLSIDSNGFKDILSSIIDINEYDINKNIITIDLNMFKNYIHEYLRFITNFGEYNILNHNLFDYTKTMTRYRYFMYLKYISVDNNQSNLYLIPTSDILLLWYCHIIYNTAKYIEFSSQLFKSHKPLKYDFLCLRKMTNDDILKTQNLWENYFGKNSYKDYSFNNFVFNDRILMKKKKIIIMQIRKVDIMWNINKIILMIKFIIIMMKEMIILIWRIKDFVILERIENVHYVLVSFFMK